MNKTTWSYTNIKHKWTVWRRAFGMWQLRTPQVAPITIAKNECSTCGTAFCGNYCPRCGQMAAVGRFSFKKALLLFLDVWGMGNRSIFRSARDLMLRPGYLIRDYVGGMQSAYFPPFKMFFLLAALSLIVEHGSGTGSGTRAERTPEQPPRVEVVEQPRDASQADQGGNDAEVKEKSVIYQQVNGAVENIIDLKDRNPAIFSLTMLLFFSWPLFFFIRKSPSIPKLWYSEFVVALVYTSNCYSLYSIPGMLLDSIIIKIWAFVMVFVALRQFSGYSKIRLLGYVILTGIISFTVFVSVIVAVLFIAYYFFLT